MPNKKIFKQHDKFLDDMEKIVITLPDGSEKKINKGITGLEIAKSIGEKLAKDALAIKVDGNIIDLNSKIEKDCKIKIITFKDKEGVNIFRHSTAHILADAVVSLFPKAKPTIGPVVDEGFYYDFDAEPFHPDDLKKIEQKMSDIAKKDSAFKRIELNEKDAKKLFKDNSYKIELIDEFKEGLGAYQHGNFVDLCRGPHVPSTDKIKAFKLTKIAGAYWRGDSRNKQLQRIYGISFPDEKELKRYLTLIEEAEKRDHRKIGKQLDLFSFHEEGAGFPFWHNKGYIVFKKLQEFWREEHTKAGYQEILTPIILNRFLWEQSGHWEHYRESMYFTKIESRDFAVKPMNCPGAILVYKEKSHSYKEFPLRIGEMGLVHRHELSGVLAGLFRVRSFTQDDAHIFLMESQIKDEIKKIISLIDRFYKAFGLEYHVELSTLPEKTMVKKEQKETAEKALKDALESIKIKYKLNQGDGAFYGPKIDFHVKDCLGRTWQCATIQLDYSMPEKFDLYYEGKDNAKHRPVMIHRVIYGAIERFIGIITEHFAGKFPLWLAPVQIRILTVANRFDYFADEIKKKFEENELRVEFDNRAESIAYKVREAQSQKIPLIITIGEKEVENKVLAVRTLDNKVQFGIKVDDFIKKAKDNIEKKELNVGF